MPKSKQTCSSIKISYPLSSQSVSLLRKDLKLNADRAAEYLESLLVLEGIDYTNKLQMSYILQLSLLFLENLADSSKYNRVVTRFLSLNMYKESYSISIALHNLLHGNEVAVTVKSPQIQQLLLLRDVDVKLCKATNVANISIYLINIARIFIGLQMHRSSSISDFLDSPNGLSCWMRRLDKPTYSSLSEHIFRLLYTTIFTSSVAYIGDERTLGHCIQWYHSSNKFEASVFDKVLAQSLKYMKFSLCLTESQILDFFQKNVFNNRKGSYSKSVLQWLDPFLRLNWKDEQLSEILKQIDCMIDNQAESILFIVEVFQHYLTGKQFSSFKALSTPNEFQSLFCALISIMNKNLSTLMYQIFQDCLLGKQSTLPSTIADLPFQELIGILREFDDDERVASSIQAAVIILSQSLFIQGKSDSQLFSLWEDFSLDLTLSARIGSLSYNIGASACAAKSFSRAIDFFDTSIRFFETAKSKDYKKELKSRQGKAQTLLKLCRFQDCLSAVLESFLKYRKVLEEFEKITENLVFLYVSAALHFDPYEPICSKLNFFSAGLIQLELDSLESQFSLPAPKLRVLEHAISLRETDVLTKCKFLLLQSEMVEPTKCEAHCREVLCTLAEFKSASGEEKALQLYLYSKVYANFGLVLNFRESDWLPEILSSWRNLLALKDYLCENRSILDLSHFCASQVFDYLKGINKLKSAVQVHSFCIHFCDLRNDSGRSTALLCHFLNAADVYVDLGHSGKAGLALSSAKNFLNRVNEVSKSRFYICYTGYLISIGNYPKAQEIRMKVNLKDNLGTEENLDARIQLNAGHIYLARENATLTHRSLLKVLKRDPVCSPLFLIQFFKALILLCNILFLQGLPLHVEYYINQGFFLSKKFGSSNSFLHLEFARLLKRKGCFSSSFEYLESASQEFAKKSDSFSLFEASILQTKGELLVATGEGDKGEASFRVANSLIDSELLEPSISLEEAFQTSLIIQEKNVDVVVPKTSNRSIGLEIFKGYISTHLGSILFKNGNFEQSEQFFSIAKSFPLTPSEKCIYLSELAKIRTRQFFLDYAQVDRSEVFEESVSRLEKGMKMMIKVKAFATLKRIEQLLNLLNDAYSSVCKFGSPDGAQQLANCLFKLFLFKCNVVGDFQDSLFDLAFSTMELPKCLFQQRQMRVEMPFPNNFLDQIEESDTIICCINMDILSETLYISRCEGSVKTMFKLPIRRFAIREGCVNGSGFSFQEAMAQFDIIMKVNKETTTGARLCVTATQKKDWVRRRAQLNEDLKSFLEKLENEWLAAFRGLLSNVSFSKCKPQLIKFHSRLEKMISSSIARCIKSRAATTCLGFDTAFCELALRGLGPKPSFDSVEDILYFILDGLQMQGITIEYDEICIEDMRDDLKAMTELFYKEASKLITSTNNKPIVLVLDKHIQHLPWESLPVMRGRPVSRVSNFQMLYDCMAQRRAIEVQNTFFVLNPSGDLTKTESKLSPHLSKWKGITGRSPSHDEFRSGLENSGLFMYFGHGGGEAYIESIDILKLKHVPAILLFGCSSGFLKGYGEFDCTGIAREYMQAGSPFVLGNLWDITDVDIDRFALSLLEKAGILDEHTLTADLDELSLVSACNSSREVCNLSYIVGSAPVLYGIPRLRLRKS